MADYLELGEVRHVWAGADFHEARIHVTDRKSGRGNCVAIVYHGMPAGGSTTEAGVRDAARRLVACWNSLVGVETPAIEAGAVAALVEAAKDALEDITGPITESGIRIRFATLDKLTAALKPFADSETEQSP
jgi:hypothetical protein